MPFSSIYPLVASVGVLIGAFGTCYHNLIVALIGGVILLTGIYLWAMEGAEGYHLHLDADGNLIEDSHAKH
jgi:cytochrome c oxidase subunit 1